MVLSNGPIAVEMEDLSQRASQLNYNFLHLIRFPIIQVNIHNSCLFGPGRTLVPACQGHDALSLIRLRFEVKIDWIPILGPGKLGTEVEKQLMTIHSAALKGKKHSLFGDCYQLSAPTRSLELQLESCQLALLPSCHPSRLACCSLGQQ